MIDYSVCQCRGMSLNGFASETGAARYINELNGAQLAVAAFTDGLQSSNVSRPSILPTDGAAMAARNHAAGGHSQYGTPVDQS